MPLELPPSSPQANTETQSATPAATPPATTPDAAAPQAQDEQRLSGAWSAIAKKEKQISATARKLSEERAQLQKDRAELEEFRKMRDGAKRNPDPFLKSVYGEKWYDALTEYKLADGRLTPELVAASVDEKFEAFRKEQEAERAKLAESSKAQAEQEYQEQLAQLSDSTKAHVEKNAAEYELINLYGSHALVPQLIEAEFERSGRVLSIQQACDYVEAHLTEQVKKATAAKKFQATPGNTAEPKRNEPPQRRTLSNDLTASTASTQRQAVSDKERWERAKAAMDEVARRRT